MVHNDDRRHDTQMFQGVASLLFECVYTSIYRWATQGARPSVVASRVLWNLQLDFTVKPTLNVSL